MPAPDKPVVAIAQGDEDVVVEMKGSSFDQETSKKDTTTAEKVEELEPVPLSTIFSFSSFEDRALVAASFWKTAFSVFSRRRLAAERCKANLIATGVPSRALSEAR